MNVELCIFSRLSLDKQHETAGLVSAYSKSLLGEQQRMRSVEAEDIFRKQLGFVALHNQIVAGYIGAEHPSRHQDQDMSKVGSLWVPSDYQGQNVGSRLITVITGELVNRGQLPYAFCNPFSKNGFLRAGYIAVALDGLPPIASSAYGNCAVKLASGANIV